MKTISYRLSGLMLAGFLMAPGVQAETSGSVTMQYQQPLNLAYYYVATRDREVRSGRYGNVYHPRHRYRDGHSEHRQGRYGHSQREEKPKRNARRAASIKPPVKPPEFIETSGSPTFVFNPVQNNWGAYDENGQLLNYGRASGGKNYCADVGRGCKTPSGSFSVYRKGGADCKSSKYPLGRGGAPMGWCMFFKGGYAIHASNDVPNHNASHGCIRVVPSAARWLSHEFMKIGTKVIVKPY